MKPLCVNNRWYIEVYTEEMGNILLLDPKRDLLPLSFATEKEALEHINKIK